MDTWLKRIYKSAYDYHYQNAIKGGEGSGNFGHEGRPGEVGGSGGGGSVSDNNKDIGNKLAEVFKKNGIPIKEVVRTRATTIVKLYGRKNAENVASILKAAGYQNINIKDDSPTIYGNDKSYRVTSFNPDTNLEEIRL